MSGDEGEEITVGEVALGDIIAIPDVDPRRRATVIAVGRFEAGPPLSAMRILLLDDAPAVQNWLRVDRRIMRWGRSDDPQYGPTADYGEG